MNADGEEVLLKAVNVGGLFVQEGWMCATELSGEEGVGVPDHLSMLSVLRERFGYDGAKELIAIYEENFFTEADFDRVKEMGFNAIRLPFGYFNLENEAGELVEFDRIDWFVEQCDQKDIYLILDLHGAYGPQNNSDHSGDVSGTNLFGNKENEQKTIKLWEAVARRYKGRSIIAGYDLLNEPSGFLGFTNALEQFPLYDALFDMTDIEKGNVLIEQGIIEIAPLAYMRGRTFNNAFVILDEAQNTTPEQMKMFLTRLGFSSTFVVTGDASQRDLPGEGGLESARRVLEGMDDIAFVDFDRNDIVRHALVARIVDAYERDASERGQS